jgi:hypothetical protein
MLLLIKRAGTLVIPSSPDLSGVHMFSRPKILPAEIISIILLELAEDNLRNVPLHARFAEDVADPAACPYRRYRALQARLAQLMLLSRAWAYACVPALYRRPLLASAPALEAFAATLAAVPARGHYVRGVVCLPFRTMYKQTARAALPHVRGRAALRLTAGSNADLVALVRACPQIDALGLRYCEIAAVRPLALLLRAPAGTPPLALRTLRICGACTDAKRRRRLELGRLISADLALPHLEELHLSDFTIGPMYPLAWPVLPALTSYSLVRTWVTSPTACVVPPDAPLLVAAAVGCEPLPGAHMFAYGLDAHRPRLRRLTVFGSLSWKDFVLKLGVFAVLEELTLEQLPCGFAPPGVEELPRGLRVLRVALGRRCGEACEAREIPLVWAVESVRAALAPDARFPLARIELVGFGEDEPDELELDAFARAQCAKRGIHYIAGPSGASFF